MSDKMKGGPSSKLEQVTELGRARLRDRMTAREAGFARLLRCAWDPFGNLRRQSQHWLVAELTSEMADDRLGVAEVPDLLDRHAIDAIYLDASALAARQIAATLTASGCWFEDRWRCLPHPALRHDHEFRRLVRPAAAGSPDIAEARGVEGAPVLDSGTCDLIRELQARIEEIAAAVLAAGPGQTLGASRIMTVGSTSRGTFTSLPVDFDLVIATEREQDQIDHRVASAVCRSIASEVARAAQLRTYWQAIPTRTAPLKEPEPEVALEWFGVRGRQSLVGRLELQWSDASARKSLPFIDITFGRIPQLIGYEMWIRRYFGLLGTANADRLRHEIRLAKTVLKRWGRVYGSANRGLRGHAVEQLVIQSHRYRASGHAFGTFGNAMRLIAEEATGSVSTDLASFDRYRRAFPLWHPGWWETEAGFAPLGHNVDLWAFLGDSDPQAAAERWRELTDLARLVAAGEADLTHLEAQLAARTPGARGAGAPS
jgi:hypothetical protein